MWTPAPFLTSSQSSGGHLHPSCPQASHLVDTCTLPDLKPVIWWTPAPFQTSGQSSGGHLWYSFPSASGRALLYLCPSQAVIWRTVIWWTSQHLVDSYSSPALSTNHLDSVFWWTSTFFLSLNHRVGSYLVDACSSPVPPPVTWWSQLFGGRR